MEVDEAPEKPPPAAPAPPAPSPQAKDKFGGWAAAKVQVAATPMPVRKVRKEPEPVIDEDIITKLSVQPFWKMPAQKSDVPPGVRLRVFDGDGAREVASMDVTQTLVFGAESERAHVVDKRGMSLSIYAEHVALVYSGKGFQLDPISGQSVVSAVTHHRPLLVKLRAEAASLPAERREHCTTVLDALEKTTVNSVLFQPGDGKRKMTWKTCVFSLARSDRLYFLDLITGDLPDDLNPNKKVPEPRAPAPEPAAPVVEKETPPESAVREESQPRSEKG